MPNSLSSSFLFSSNPDHSPTHFQITKPKSKIPSLTTRPRASPHHTPQPLRAPERPATAVPEKTDFPIAPARPICPRRSRVRGPLFAGPHNRPDRFASRAPPRSVPAAQKGPGGGHRSTYRASTCLDRFIEYYRRNSRERSTRAPLGTGRPRGSKDRCKCGFAPAPNWQ